MERKVRERKKEDWWGNEGTTNRQTHRIINKKQTAQNTTNRQKKLFRIDRWRKDGKIFKRCKWGMAWKIQKEDFKVMKIFLKETKKCRPRKCIVVFKLRVCIKKAQIISKIWISRSKMIEVLMNHPI